MYFDSINLCAWYRACQWCNLDSDENSYSDARSEGTGTITTEEQEQESKVSRCLTALRKATTFLFSHIGLLALVSGYCIVGGLTFEHLEKENELSVKREMREHRVMLGDKIWHLTQSSDYLREDNWTRRVESEMKKFEKEIIKAMKVRGWDGSEDENKMKWTFPGSLFYSIVLISTIGYGDQTPKTQWGKVRNKKFLISIFSFYPSCLA